MNEYESVDDQSKKFLTQCYLKDMAGMQESAKKYGGEVVAYPSIPRRERVAFGEISKLASDWGVEVKLPEPTEVSGVTYDVVVPIYTHAEEEIWEMPVLRDESAPRSALALNYWDENSPQAVKKRTKWWRRWLPRKKVENKTGCGMAGDFTFDEILEQLDTMFVKEELNNQLKLAGRCDQFDLTRWQGWVKWAIGKKNRIGSALKALWTAVRR